MYSEMHVWPSWEGRLICPTTDGWKTLVGWLGEDRKGEVGTNNEHQFVLWPKMNECSYNWLENRLWTLFFLAIPCSTPHFRPRPEGKPDIATDVMFGMLPDVWYHCTVLNHCSVEQLLRCVDILQMMSRITPVLTHVWNRRWIRYNHFCYFILSRC